jgi:hypothetical protein
MYQFLLALLIMGGHSLNVQAQPEMRADPRGPCELYPACIRSCYNEPRPTMYYDPRNPGRPYCSAEGEVLSWLLSTAASSLVSSVVPPSRIPGIAGWFFDKALRKGVSKGIAMDLKSASANPECSSCMDRCVGHLVACHNRPVANGGACGTFQPTQAGTPKLGRGSVPSVPAFVTQTRACAGSSSLCCENNSRLQFQPRTAFCYSAADASGLVCASVPGRASASSADSTGRDEALASESIREGLHF